MPTSGLVLTISPVELIELNQHLEPDPRFTVGELQGHHLPVVYESETLEQHRSAWRWLEHLPGVRSVELAYHDFSDVRDFGPQPPREQRGRGRPPSTDP